MAKKERLGDWECDTVIGNDRKSVLVTVVDRASLYTVCSRVLTRLADVVSQAIIRLLFPFKERVKTLMFDNGSECVTHERIARALEATANFPTIFSSLLFEKELHLLLEFKGYGNRIGDELSVAGWTATRLIRGRGRD